MKVARIEGSEEQKTHPPDVSRAMPACAQLEEFRCRDPAALVGLRFNVSSQIFKSFESTRLPSHLLNSHLQRNFKVKNKEFKKQGILKSRLLLFSFLLKNKRMVFFSFSTFPVSNSVGLSRRCASSPWPQTSLGTAGAPRVSASDSSDENENENEINGFFQKTMDFSTMDSFLKKLFETFECFKKTLRGLMRANEAGLIYELGQSLNYESLFLLPWRQTARSHPRLNVTGWFSPSFLLSSWQRRSKISASSRCPWSWPLRTCYLTSISYFYPFDNISKHHWNKSKHLETDVFKNPLCSWRRFTKSSMTSTDSGSWLCSRLQTRRTEEKQEDIRRYSKGSSLLEVLSILDRKSPC